MTTKHPCLLLLLSAVTVLPGRATTYSNCDVTHGGTTNVSDVQRMILEAMGSASAANDLNGDGKVDVADVQIVTNAAMGLGCSADNAAGFTITGFNPTSGPIGTPVTVTGNNFGSTPQVTMPMLGGGAIPQPLSSASATSVAFMIAAGTATGPITVSSGSSSVNSSTVFTVTPSNTFTLTAGPPSANVIRGQSVAYAVQLASSNGFTGLAALSVSGVPAGVTASLKPSSITAGQISLLTLTAPAGQALSSANLSITASASVEGIAIQQSAAVTLAIVAPTTSFLGRTVVADNLETPLVGATVTTLGQDGGGNTTGCTGHSTVSDAAGNFVLTNLPASCVGPQLIGFDGTTVTSPAGKYAGVNLVFTLVSGKVVVSPVLVHMPRSDNLETFMVNQNSSVDQSYTFKSIPGLSVTVYAGTTITAPDGVSQPNPYPLAAVEIPIDRLPDAMPLTNSMVTAFIVSFPPANTTTNQPVAVWFPNTLNTPPGNSVVLMTLNPTLGRMVAYGTGTISNDGITIVPDIDPSTGSLQHRFGIVHFDWHGPAANPPTDVSPTPCSCPYPPGSAAATAADPVDLSTGLQTLTSTDLDLSGGRGSIAITRTYRSLSTQTLAFGIGSGSNYAYRLASNNSGSPSVINLQMPNGAVIPFSVQPDGTLTNQTVPSMSGVVLTLASNAATLRFKSGSYFTFTPAVALQGSAPGTLISLLTSIGDTNGNVIQIQYQPGPAGLISEIDDPVGRKLVFTWNSGSDVITSITDPIGRVVSYTYNPAGYLATFTDVMGGVTQYTYDSQNRLASVTDPRGVVLFQNTFDVNGRVATQTTPSGGTYHFAYTLSNALVPTSPVLQTVVTDPLGNATTYRFNTQGYMVGATDASGQTRTMIRAPGTNLLLSESGAGSCSVCGNPAAGDFTYTYDQAGNVLSATDSRGATAAWTYDPVSSRLLSATDPAGNVTRYTYDAHLNPVTITSPKNDVTTISYTAFGQVAQIASPSGSTLTLTYNSLGDLTQIADQTGSTTQLSYDGVSRPIQATDQSGSVSQIAYDAMDRITAQTDALGRTVSFTYDSVGGLVGVTDSAGNKTSYTYNAMERPLTKTDPLGKTESYSYDAVGDLIGRVDRRGATAAFQYDALERLTGETYSDGQTVSRAYDANGRLIRVDDSSGGVFSYTYDSGGLLQKSITPYGSVAYTRDIADRLLTRQVGGQAPVSYSYDADDNVTNIASGTVSVSTTYNAAGLPLNISRSNGVNTAIAYDQLSRILSIAHSKASTPLLSTSFSYDGMGHRSQAQTSSGQAPATLSATGTVNANNQLTGFGSDVYTYDANGNRLTDTSAAGTTAYTWDARNRLTKIAAPGGVTYTLGYDFAGNLTSERATSPSSNILQQGILDDLANVSAIIGSAGTSSVVSGPSADRNVAIVDPQGNATFALQGTLNSTSGATDASGAPASETFYEPFGVTSGTGTQYLFQYAGRNQIAPNLYNMRARFYDAAAGRFISEDPLGAAGGDSNLYRYAGNDPIEFSDPSGLSRAPDFYSVSLGIPKFLLPYVPSKLKKVLPRVVSRTYTVDAWGNIYSSPGTGWSIGAGATGSVNWLKKDDPTEEDVSGFLTGFGKSISIVVPMRGGLGAGYTEGESCGTIAQGIVFGEAGVSVSESYGTLWGNPYRAANQAYTSTKRWFEDKANQLMQRYMQGLSVAGY